MMLSLLRKIKDYILIKQSGLFDEEYYCLQYADVRQADVNSLWHFINSGWREGRKPSDYFDTIYYLSQYPDVASANINPLIHFIRFGAKEGRKPNKNFDPAWYMKTYPQVRTEKTNPLLHYIRFGRSAGFRTMPDNIEGTLKQDEGKYSEKIFPSVSIVIPVFNALDCTKACLEAIEEKDTKVLCEIIVIDNGSTDGTKAWLDAYAIDRPLFRVVHNDSNRGFAPAVNQGILLSLGEYIVILNNDTIPGEGWLDRLILGMKEDDYLGIVSPITNYVGEGPQLAPEANGLLDYEIDRFSSQIVDRNTIDYVPSRLVFFCVMLKRALIDTIGVLDEGYVRGNFEDDDYCFRAIMAGYKLGIVKNAFVYHRGSASFKANNMDYVQHFEENRTRFFTKVTRIASKLPLFPVQVNITDVHVSVILRTVNRPEMLKHALNSLVNQTVKNFEVIIVNDGGSDINELLKPYQAFLNIVYVWHQKGKGRTAALNAGIAASKAPWICFLDDDDIFYPWFIDTMLDASKQNPEQKFLYAETMRALFDLDSSDLIPLEIKPFGRFKYSRERMLVGNAIPINTWFLSRSLYDEVGGFDESFDTLEDYEFLLRATTSTNPIGITRTISEYRFYLSITNSMARSRDDALEALTRIYNRYPVDNEEMIKQRAWAISLHKTQAESVTALLAKHPESSDSDKKEIAREILRIICAI
jgi:GT2 family glycosyltransferase